MCDIDPTRDLDSLDSMFADCPEHDDCTITVCSCTRCGGVTHFQPRYAQVNSSRLCPACKARHCPADDDNDSRYDDTAAWSPPWRTRRPTPLGARGPPGYLPPNPVVLDFRGRLGP